MKMRCMAGLRSVRLLLCMIGALVSGSAMADNGKGTMLVLSDALTNHDFSTGKSSNRKEFVIRAIEPESEIATAVQVTWLGVSVEEAPEALADQLGLRPGEGMVVNYVSDQSPAAGGGLRKNDVLVALDDQILVDSVQLRKLVQMRKAGDVVKVTFYRGGKRQSIDAKLEMKTWQQPSAVAENWEPGTGNLKINFGELDGAQESLNKQMNTLAQSLAQAGVNKEQLKLEVQETMEQTRKAIQDAMRNSRDALEAQRELRSANAELSAVAGSGIGVGKDTTVVVRNDGKPTRTLVITDETGCYVFVANPRRHLTAYDKYGKLLFDGPVDTPEQRKKVPLSIWERVRSLLSQSDRGEIRTGYPMA